MTEGESFVMRRTIAVFDFNTICKSCSRTTTSSVVATTAVGWFNVVARYPSKAERPGRSMCRDVGQAYARTPRIFISLLSPMVHVYLSVLFNYLLFMSFTPLLSFFFSLSLSFFFFILLLLSHSIGNNKEKGEFE